MADPFVGEIRMFGGNFAPLYWYFCDGSLLPISEYDVLFNLIGTTYGGDGQSTFQLPDLRSRVPVHDGQGPGLPYYTMGETGGAEAVTLTPQTMPQHSHALFASTDNGIYNTPVSNLPARGTNTRLYYQDAPSPSLSLANEAIQPAGEGQPHTNIQPYLAVNFIIAWSGIYPSPF